MTFSHTIRINATPQTIYRHYADVPNWHRWDKEVKHASIEGTFANGTRGTLKPRKGPKTSFVLQEVIEDRSFCTLSTLPLCSMRFCHTLTLVDDNTTEVTHTLTFEGLLAPLWGRIIGRTIDRTIPDALTGLAHMCASSAL